jgi:hypothetical protein
MPYQIRKAGDNFEVVEKDTQKVVGTHRTEEEAKAQLAALYAELKDAKSKDVEPTTPAVKVGAMISAANKAKLKAAHDAIRELMPECCEGEEKEEVESIDTAGDKSAEINLIVKRQGKNFDPIEKPILPLFNYVAKLHLPYDDEYLRDMVAVKSVARDTIRGYTMLWGNPDLTDVETEFFSPKTDFWDEQLKGITRPLTYDHAQDPSTKKDPVIGTIEAFGDDEIGRWFVAQLDRNHKYRKAIDGLISQRAQGASSDSASQYVIRKSAGKAVWLAQWPWFASALTPTPAEPRMLDVGLAYWKSAGVDFARMGAPEGAQKIPAALRIQAEILKIKAGVR